MGTQLKPPFWGAPPTNTGVGQLKKKSYIVMELCTRKTNIPPKLYWSGKILSPNAFALKSRILTVKNTVIRMEAHLLLIYHSSSVPFSFNNLIHKRNFCGFFFPYSQFWAGTQLQWIFEEKNYAKKKSKKIKCCWNEASTLQIPKTRFRRFIKTKNWSPTLLERTGIITENRSTVTLNLNGFICF